MTEHNISACCWVDKDHFVTAAGSEVTLWSTKLEDPVSILDICKTDSILLLHSKLSSKGRFSVAATSKNTCNIFKLNFST